MDIKTAREAAGLTQEQAARKLDISLSSYRNIERKRTQTDILTGLRIALLFKCSPYDIFPIKDN